MARKRKSDAVSLEAQAALAAMKGDQAINDPAKQYGVRRSLIHGWRKHRLAGVGDVVARNNRAETGVYQTARAHLYEWIDRLRMDLEGLKKTRCCRLKPDGG